MWWQVGFGYNILKAWSSRSRSPVWQVFLPLDSLWAFCLFFFSCLFLACRHRLGPGSGKTRVVTARVAYLHLARKVIPERIVLLTFTNKVRGAVSESGALFAIQPALTHPSLFYFPLLESRLRKKCWNECAAILATT